MPEKIEHINPEQRKALGVTCDCDDCWEERSSYIDERESPTSSIYRDDDEEEKK